MGKPGKRVQDTGFKKEKLPSWKPAHIKRSFRRFKRWISLGDDAKIAVTLTALERRGVGEEARKVVAPYKAAKEKEAAEAKALEEKKALDDMTSVVAGESKVPKVGIFAE